MTSESVKLNREIAAVSTAADLLAMCGAHMSEFDAVNLVTALHRLAKTAAGPAPAPAPAGAVVAGLLGRVRAALPDFGAQGLSNTAWACARLRV